jgi:hypothetical protein
MSVLFDKCWKSKMCQMYHSYGAKNLIQRRDRRLWLSVNLATRDHLYLSSFMDICCRGTSNIHIEDRTSPPCPSIYPWDHQNVFYTDRKLNLGRGLNVTKVSLRWNFKGKRYAILTLTLGIKTWVRMVELEEIEKSFVSAERQWGVCLLWWMLQSEQIRGRKARSCLCEKLGELPLL